MTKRPKTAAHCHKDVAETAKAAAAEMYELVMSNNLVFAEWKKQHPGANDKTLRNSFIAKNWGKCIPLARATMARLLGTSTDLDLKERVYDALCKDRTLTRGREFN